MLIVRRGRGGDLASRPDLSGRDDLRIDPAVHVIEIAQQASSGIARSRTPVSGSTLVAAQRVIRLVTLSRASPMLTSLPEQIELVPGGPALDVEIARKRSGCTGAPTTVSIAATEARLMIDTTLAATSEKLWPFGCSTFGGPRSSPA
jgi:hypothetical protein